MNGFVRNSEDGGVEAVFQGKLEDIEKMIELCRKGPMLSVIKQFGVEWEDPTDRSGQEIEKFEGFDVR